MNKDINAQNPDYKGFFKQVAEYNMFAVPIDCEEMVRLFDAYRIPLDSGLREYVEKHK
jgi:hypothetical protein